MLRDVAQGADEDFADLFENAPCGYLSLEPTGHIHSVNQTLAGWLSRDKSELRGGRFQDLLNIAGKVYYETHFAPLLRMQGYFNEVALELIRAAGRPLPVLVNAVERRDVNGDVQFIRVTVFNASDRRRYEQELLHARRIAESANLELAELNKNLEDRVALAVAERMAAEEALRQAQKMEAIGQLTGGVAHDFNNLLTVILGGLEIIGKQAPDLPEGPHRDRIERARRMSVQATDRAATLTSRLLAFARRQPLDPKPTDAAKLVTNMADMLERTLGAGVRLETVAGAGLWRTLVDRLELERAIINLAVNARDAMPEGGRLTIETTNAFLDEDYVAGVVEPVPAGQYVLVAVSDTGTGMDAETQVKVFEPFFTTKSVGKGTGLGLSQVYGFVRQTGGHIRIYSELDVGTTVKIYLPKCTDDAHAGPEIESRDLGPIRGGGETILVVEDHDDLRSYSTEVLAELGYRVLAARDGLEALDVVGSPEQIDLLFTDVVLPDGLDGRQVADKARAARPGLKVLFTTGYTRNAIVHNGRLDAGLDLISKPFTSSALAAKVRKVLDG